MSISLKWTLNITLDYKKTKTETEVCAYVCASAQYMHTCTYICKKNMLVDLLNARAVFSGSTLW